MVIAQVRTTASDLMVASGIEQEEANRLVRQAFGEMKPPTGTERPRVGTDKSGLRDAPHPPASSF